MNPRRRRIRRHARKWRALRAQLYAQTLGQLRGQFRTTLVGPLISRVRVIGDEFHVTIEEVRPVPIHEITCTFSIGDPK